MYQAPAIITEDTLRASCQLSTSDKDVYRLDTGAYLAATSEQTLAGFYQHSLVDRKSLPIRMGGYSTCFRKEAGAHGRDIHGIFRVHQFEKIEQFALVEPKGSATEMERMIGISEAFYRSLKIPFRVVSIVSGELNDAAACKYDLEGWFPSQQRFRELVSVSNCTDYQSRQLNVQFLGLENKPVYVHMLNGTLIAIQRAITCFLENWHQQDHISIPEVLQPYMRCAALPLGK